MNLLFPDQFREVVIQAEGPKVKLFRNAIVSGLVLNRRYAFRIGL